MNTGTKSRVLVAMSGGVDSSVAASLLLEQGYDVIGANMQVQLDCASQSQTNCSSADIEDAKIVAKKLSIPFHVFYCGEFFRSKVIEPFITDYSNGLTPSPCVLCNSHIKFDYLIKQMRLLNCDYLATGHYARIVNTAYGFQLMTSKDTWKDQTYFLFNLHSSALSNLLFPIGNLLKTEVRDYALEKGLINARKKDSVGICFIGKQDYGDFLNKELSAEQIKSGLLKIWPSGEALGKHTGIHNFTIGQRRGLNLDYHKRLYVVFIDSKNHTVWLGEEKWLFRKQMNLKNAHWLINDALGTEDHIYVKIRQRHIPAKARIINKKKYLANCITIEFLEPQRAITPGQAAVFYSDSYLIGGGWIDELPFFEQIENI